jgi:hypothetical protein
MIINIYRINIKLYIVSLVYLITAIMLNVNQYKHNQYYYQNKNNEDINPISDVVTYKPTLLDSFFSTIGINGYYINGVLLQTLYIIVTFFLYSIVEYTFGFIVAILIFIGVIISNYYYTWIYKSKICNDPTLYSSIPTFCCGSNLMVTLLAMVELIFFTWSKQPILKLFIILIFMLTYIGVCIYDNLNMNPDALNSMNMNDKICNSTMWHGFYFIEGVIMFILFYSLKKLFR